MATKRKTKRKTKRYADGSDMGDFAGVDEAVARNADSGEWARGENYGDNTTGDERVAMARAPAREASAEEVMAANKFAPSARPRPRPTAAPAPQQVVKVATAAREVANDMKRAESKAEAPSGPRVGRASQASVDRAPRNQPTKEGLKSMRAQDAEQRSDFANSRLMRGLRSMFGTPKTRGGSAYKSGGSVKQTASSRGDGIAKRGKTRGKLR